MYRAGQVRKASDKGGECPPSTRPIPPQRGSLLWKPGVQGGAGPVARPGMSEHGSPQQDMRVV